MRPGIALLLSVLLLVVLAMIANVILSSYGLAGTLYAGSRYSYAYDKNGGHEFQISLNGDIEVDLPFNSNQITKPVQPGRYQVANPDNGKLVTRVRVTRQDVQRDTEDPNVAANG